jgi:hypothetical protein
MRKSVVHIGEESPLSPLLQRGEHLIQRGMAFLPPLQKGGWGGFSDADLPTKAHHAR